MKLGTIHSIHSDDIIFPFTIALLDGYFGIINATEQSSVCKNLSPFINNLYPPILFDLFGKTSFNNGGLTIVILPQ